MAPHTAYAELGLTPGASEPEAKAAWRRMASQWHPDRNASTGAVARMQRINLAFEALRRAGFPADAGADLQPDPSRPTPDAADAADAADAPASPPRTLRRKVRITLEEATLGCMRVLRGTERVRCAGCAGRGVVAQALSCAACAGLGRVRQAGWFSLFGGFSGALADCADCAGSGRVAATCPLCAGQGQHRTAGYRLNVRLPPGVRHGDELQVDASRRADKSVSGGGPAADLLVCVAVLPHPFFTLRDDGGLHCTLPVSGFAWMAGHSVQVPTPDGWHRLALDRAHTDHRIAGAGFPVHRRGPRGDLWVHVVPRFPPALTTDQHILIDQLAATQTGPGADADPALRAWQQTLARHLRGRGA